MPDPSEKYLGLDFRTRRGPLAGPLGIRSTGTCATKGPPSTRLGKRHKADKPAAPPKQAAFFKHLLRFMALPRYTRGQLFLRTDVNRGYSVIVRERASADYLENFLYFAVSDAANAAM